MKKKEALDYVGSAQIWNFAFERISAWKEAIINFRDLESYYS